MHGIGVEYVWNTHGMCMEEAWNMHVHGIWMDMFGICMAYVWGISIEYAWHRYGM